MVSSAWFSLTSAKLVFREISAFKLSMIEHFKRLKPIVKKILENYAGIAYQTGVYSNANGGIFNSIKVTEYKC